MPLGNPHQSLRHSFAFSRLQRALGVVGEVQSVLLRLEVAALALGSDGVDADVADVAPIKPGLIE